MEDIQATKIFSKVHVCRKCEHVWARGGVAEPKRCPSCLSVLWNREKRPNGGEQRAAAAKDPATRERKATKREPVPVVAPVGTGESRAKEKEEPVVVVREEEPRPAPVTAPVEGKVNPNVAKLRAALGLKVATEIEPLEEEVWEQGGGSELPEGHVYLDELEVPFNRAYQCAVMNKKGSGLKQVESGRWVAKREWVDGMKEAGR